MLEQSLLNRPVELLDKTAFPFGCFATSSPHLFHKKHYSLRSPNVLNNLIP